MEVGPGVLGYTAFNFLGHIDKGGCHFLLPFHPHDLMRLEAIGRKEGKFIQNGESREENKNLWFGGIEEEAFVWLFALAPAILGKHAQLGLWPGKDEVECFSAGCLRKLLPSASSIASLDTTKKIKKKNINIPKLDFYHVTCAVYPNSLPPSDVVNEFQLHCPLKPQYSRPMGWRIEAPLSPRFTFRHQPNNTHLTEEAIVMIYDTALQRL